jgi:hypothetical protein
VHAIDQADIRNPNPYRRLGVSTNATSLEIAEAAEQRIPDFHNRMQKGGTDTDYLFLKDAYERLIDPAKRVLVDRQLGFSRLNPVAELPGWRERFDAFFKKYPHTMKGGLSDLGIDLKERSRHPGDSSITLGRVVDLDENRLTTSALPRLDSLKSESEELWEQLNRKDILQFSPLYRSYLNERATTLFRQKETPQEFDTWVHGQLNWARSKTWPGVWLGLPIMAFFGCGGNVIGSCLFAHDVFWKSQAFIKRRLNEAKLLKQLEKKRGHHLISKNPETLRYTTFADGLIAFDLFYFHLWPIVQNQKAFQISRAQKDLRDYLAAYHNRYPWEEALIHFVKRVQSIAKTTTFSKALLFRNMQDNNTQLRTLMFEDAHYWISIATELLEDLQLQKEGEVNNEIQVLKTFRQELETAQRGFISRNLKSVPEGIIDCGHYIAHVAHTTQSLLHKQND